MHLDATTQWGIGVAVTFSLGLYSIVRASRAAERERIASESRRLEQDAEFVGRTEERLRNLERFRDEHVADHRSMGARRDAR